MVDLNDTLAAARAAAPPLASEERARLASEGYEGAALDLLLREGAPARHEWRVRATLAAAFDEARRLDPELAEEGAAEPLLCAAWGLLTLDARGVGGRHDCEGAGTARMSWARSLGAGRHHALDGEAWSAALDAAIALVLVALGEALGGAVRLDILPDEDEPALDVAAKCMRGGAEDQARYSLPVSAEDARWVAAEAARALLDPARRAPEWGRAFNAATPQEEVHGGRG